VADRIDFLAALADLVLVPEAKPRVKEHDELHRVLEDSCWGFGEEYALHVSGRSLHEVLVQHRGLLGRDAFSAWWNSARSDRAVRHGCRTGGCVRSPDD
jgi:hypothetical protein